MSTGIVFHRDDQLMIVREQKKIIGKCISSGHKTFPFYPLNCLFKGEWANGKSAKELKAEIIGIELLHTTICKGQLLIPVRVTLREGGTAMESVLIGNVVGAMDLETSSTFEKKIRVFQLADIKKTGPVTEVTNPVWCKIK